jgi:hypothetical protein
VITIESELLAIARVGLPGALPPPRGGWGERLESVMANGLAGLFSASAAAGLVDIDSTMAARLQQQLELEASRAVQLEGELLRLGPALARIGALVMWGPVLAHGAYSDPLFRPFSRLDLLVPGRRMPEAVAVFAHYGYQRAPSPTGSGLDARVGKAFVLEHPGGVRIRVHRTLAAGSVNHDAGRQAAGEREVTIASHPVSAPSWEAHLLECALDAMVGGGLTRPLALRDIAEILHHPALDPSAAVELAEMWQMARPVGYSLRAARDALGLDLPPAFAALARRPAEPPAAMPVPPALPDDDAPQPMTMAAPHAFPPPGGRHNGDNGRSPLPVPYLDVLPEAAGTSMGEPIAPAGVPALPPARAFVKGELATVDLGERSSPSLVRTAYRNGTQHPRVGVVAGRQGAWTSARPPRQGTTRARSRSGATGAGRNGAGDRSGDDNDGPGPDEPPSSPTTPGGATSGAPPTRIGLAVGLTGGLVLVIAAACTQLGNNRIGGVLVPIAAMLLAVAAGHRIGRRRAGEDWVGRWLVLAVGVKLVASYVRYHTLVNEYGGNGDATGYDQFGRLFARAWLGEGGVAPELGDMRQHNFVRWFTGVVYYLFGIDMVTGFLVFGLLALVGSYLWYRATVDAVPGINRRLYLALVMFLPSMAYWPASIGKESLMQLAIGMVALATAHLLRQRLARAFVLGAPGGLLLWYVRPHLLAMALIAVGCAYLGGRVRGAASGLRAFVGRPVGMLAVALLVGFAVSQGADFLGLEDLSIDSVEARLDQESEATSGFEAGSSFETGGSSLNPLYLPEGAVTVLLRPFPWETDSPLQLLASLESALVAALILVRLPSLRAAITRARSAPFLLFCWGLVILYAATFSSIGNFGILVRQRSLVLPALFVLVAMRPIPTTTAADTNTRATTRSTTSGGVHAGRY